MKGEDMDWREENKLKQKAQEYYEKEFSYNQVYIQGYSDGYAMAIDEFAEKIQWEYLNSCGLKQREIDFLVAVSSMVAGQMKAGADNE